MKLFLFIRYFNRGDIIGKVLPKVGGEGGGRGEFGKKQKGGDENIVGRGGGSIELQKGRGGQTFFTLCANFDINSNFRIRPFS